MEKLNLDKISHEYRFRLSKERSLEKKIGISGFFIFILFYSIVITTFFSGWGLLLLIILVILGFICYKNLKILSKLKLTEKERIILNLILLKNHIEEHIKSKTPSTELNKAGLVVDRIELLISNASNLFFVNRGFEIDENICYAFGLLRLFLKNVVREHISKEPTNKNLKDRIKDLGIIINYLYNEKFEEVRLFLKSKNLDLKKTPITYKIWDKFYKFDLKERVFTIVIVSIIVIIACLILIKYNLFTKDNTFNIILVILGIFALYKLIEPFSKFILERINNKLFRNKISKINQ